MTTSEQIQQVLASLVRIESRTVDLVERVAKVEARQELLLESPPSRSRWVRWRDAGSAAAGGGVALGVLELIHALL